MSKRFTIAYLSSAYPRATDTFVRTEVEFLRTHGFDVHPYSVRRVAHDQLITEEIAAEARRTEVLFERGTIAGLIWAVLRFAFASPIRLVSAVRLLWRSGGAGVTARIKQGAYLLEGAYLAKNMLQRGVGHLHNHIGGNSASVAMVAAHLSEIPYSITIHGMEFLDSYRLGIPDKIGNSAFTICATDYCRGQSMIFARPEHWDKIHVVHCAVNPSFFEGTAVPSPDNKRFICVGRLSREKGQLLLVEAAARLKERGVEFEIVLVGDGELRSLIQDRIAQHGLESSFRLLGWLDSKAVKQEILGSRALIVPSFIEGLPLAVMEALASRRPVISTRVGGIPELVEPGRCGWIISPGSAESLAESMEEALGTPVDVLAQMGDEGFERVKRQHSAATEVGRLAKLIAASAEKFAQER